MKTPEEIKRGLECKKRAFANNCGDKCSASCGWYFPAYGTHERCADALAYIQQLERDNAQKDERIRQLEREKEALLKESKHGGMCFTCKHKNTPMDGPPCSACWRCDCWEWRGVEEDEHA